MKVFIIDNDTEIRTVLISRVEEAVRQSGIRRVQIVETDVRSLGLGTPEVAFIGPGCCGDLDDVIQRVRAVYPKIPLAAVLPNEVYATEAIELRKNIPVRLMPIADIAQMAQFLLETAATSDGFASGRGIVSVCQAKGGVGVTSLTLALAACWVEHQLRVAVVDLNDVNPHITDWARVGTSHRNAVAEALRLGAVKVHQLDEICAPVHGYDGRLHVVGQPVDYSESFHFKADIIPDAPSAESYIISLLEALASSYDIVIVDCGSAWGVASVAVLPMSSAVLLTIDDDKTSLRRTMDNISRVYRESDDSQEFDLRNWKIVLNAYTGDVLSNELVEREIEELDIFPQSMEIFRIPFSDLGREWSLTSKTLFENSESPAQHALRNLAFHLSPFRFEAVEEEPQKQRRKLF